MGGSFTGLIVLQGIWLNAVSPAVGGVGLKPVMRWPEHWRSSHDGQQHGVSPGVRWWKHFKAEKKLNAS